MEAQDLIELQAFAQSLTDADKTDDLFAMSLAACLQENYALAVELLNKLMKNNNYENAKAYWLKGFAKAGSGEYYEAIINYGVVIDLNPKDVSAYYNRGRIWLLKSNSKDYAETGDHAEAIEDFSKAIELDSKHARAYLYRGTIKFVLEDHEGVIKDCDMAIKLDPKLAEAYYTRGLAKYTLRKNQPEVLKDLNKAGELGYSLAYDVIKDIQQNG